MNKKVLLPVVGVALIAGITGGFILGQGFGQAGYAKTLDQSVPVATTIGSSPQNNNLASSGCQGISKADRDKMISLMKKNGFKEAAQLMKKGDYNGMENFMRSLSDKDYQKMIEIMKESGYTDMAKHMETIGKEQMLKMHDSMMGSGSGQSAATQMMQSSI